MSYVPYGEKEKKAIAEMVGTDGLERIIAIARLMPRDSDYRINPYLLACHLFNQGIKSVEQAIAEAVEPRKTTSEQSAGAATA